MIKLSESENDLDNIIENNNESENSNKLVNNKELENIESENSELSIESNIINNKEEEKIQPTCGAINFREKLEQLSKDSFDESSEYSYVSIEEDKPGINYLYYIVFSIGLVLLYIFYNNNIFLTFIEFVLNCIYPYIYVPIKLYMCKKIIIQKLRSINLD
jgi:hypothetical protein